RAVGEVGRVDAPAPIAGAAWAASPVGVIERPEARADQVDLVVGVDGRVEALQDTAVGEPPVPGGIAIRQAEPGIIRPSRQRAPEPSRTGLPARAGQANR